VPEGEKSGPVDVAVVGGGAAGMVAAVAAARLGASVVVLERGERVGRKLLATGNGRCNLTNVRPDPARWHCGRPGFVEAVVGRFGVPETLAFFSDLGIPAVVEEDGRAFPRSRQASAVLDVLRRELDEAGVRVVCQAEAVALQPLGDGLDVIVAGGESVRSASVVLAAGGRAAPSLGGTPAGYALATSLGHRLVEPFPSLVQVRLASPLLKSLQGTRFDGTVEALSDGETVARARGEVLFTDYGASGNAVLDVSRAVGEHVRRGRTVALRLAVVDDMDADALAADLATRLSRPDRTVASAMIGLIHKKLAPAVVRSARVEPSTPCGRLSGEDRGRLAAALSDWRLDVIDTAGWAGAQVTAGGIDAADVDESTLESRIVPGLHFAGEVLDVDGDCGGFNLQWAWSSGRVAGLAAARPRGA
jgi:predicted Rossmann fold flavoprotein